MATNEETADEDKAFKKFGEEQREWANEQKRRFEGLLEQPAQKDEDQEGQQETKRHWWQFWK